MNCSPQVEDLNSIVEDIIYGKPVLVMTTTVPPNTMSTMSVPSGWRNLTYKVTKGSLVTVHTYPDMGQSIAVSIISGPQGVEVELYGERVE